MEIDTRSAHDAARRLRHLSEPVRTSEGSGALALPGAAPAATSLARLIQAERRYWERASDRLAHAARHLEDVVSAALAADRYDGGPG